MPKNRNWRNNKKRNHPTKEADISKPLTELFDRKIPDDQKSLLDRLSNQDAKVREMAYITLSTVDLFRNKTIQAEIFSPQASEIVVKSISDPLRKNSLCAFAAIVNVLNSADLTSNEQLLSDYIKIGLLDDIYKNVREVAVQLTENWNVMHNKDLEKLLLYIENSFNLLGKPYHFNI